MAEQYGRYMLVPKVLTNPQRKTVLILNDRSIRPRITRKEL